MSFASTAPLGLVGKTVQVRSDLLGTFEIAENHVFDFPNGLLGFPECRRYALVRAGTDSIFWLQSTDLSALVFLLVDPFQYFTDFSVELAAIDIAELGARDPGDIAVLAIVTLPAPGALDRRPTANLQGPLAINLRGHSGKQLICEGEHGIRCAFELPVSA